MYAPSSPDAPPQRAAQLALACLDLTSLNGADTEADIARLCERARGPHGAPAAVCVWPRLAAFARREAPPAVAVAAVANFPDGSLDVARVVREVGQIVQAGAQEVDVVLPWRALLAGDEAGCARVLDAARRACEGLRLKVILESGELADPVRIQRAGELALAAGADFLKTSTGKTRQGASPEAARTMLALIARQARAAAAQAAGGAAGLRVGFKASGGVRTVADAALYMGLVAQALGEQAVGPQRFRIGASGLLDDIETVLGWPAGQAYPQPQAGPGATAGTSAGTAAGTAADSSPY
ncbi:MAG: deoxyribose-phosphate aldolase [Rubrivivax sp.]